MFTINPNVFLYRFKIESYKHAKFLSPEELLKELQIHNIKLENLQKTSPTSIYWNNEKTLRITEYWSEGIDWGDLQTVMKNKIVEIMGISIKTPETFILNALSLYNKDKFKYNIYLINLRKNFPISEKQ